MRHLTIQDIQVQETEVEDSSESALTGFAEYSNRFLNTLIELLYATPVLQTISSDADAVKSQARHWFHSSIFTFRAAFLLSNRGYYLESQILDRALIELLVKLRYFHKHPNEMKDFQSIATKKKNTISWKKMFEEVMPGYYADEYSWSLSYVAHGGVGANAYRMKRDHEDNRFADLGVSYKEFWAGASINQKTAFMLGYLRTYRKIFPELVDFLNPELRTELSAVEDFLEKSLKEHIARKGGPNEWHQSVHAIWNV
jgi:hypothetical protein